MSAYKQAFALLNMVIDNNTDAANAAADIRRPLQGLNLAPRINLGEKVCHLKQYVHALHRHFTTIDLLEFLSVRNENF